MRTMLEAEQVPRPRIEARAPGPARRAARAWIPEALFAALLVVAVAPPWLVAHVPTQDGGNHVEAVLGLLELPSSPLLQAFYHANYGPQPNWLTQALFAALVQVASPQVAEKLVLSGYLLLTPLALRAALPATTRGRWAALGIFPLLHGYTFHMGFWNFCYSLALFFAVVGAFARWRGRVTWRRGALLAVLGVALFAAHAVSTASAIAAIAAVLAWRAWRSAASARSPARRRAVLSGYARRAGATALALLPAAALLTAFALRQPRPIAFRPPLLDYLKHFFSLYTLVSFDRREIYLAAAVALVLGAAVAAGLRERRRRRLRLSDGWLAAALVASAAYFASPDAAADGAQISDRMNLYPAFAALLWLGWSTLSRRRVRAAALALTAVFLAASALRVARYRELDGYIAEYLSAAPHVPEGSALLPLAFAPFGPRAGGRIDGAKLLSYRVEVFRHLAGWIAAERRGVDLDNSQANTRHAPLRWRWEMNPFRALQTRPFGVEQEPPCVELWVYPALGGRIDRVLTWGVTGPSRRDECGAAVLAELEAGWERVWVSSPRGLAELWRPRRAAEP